MRIHRLLVSLCLAVAPALARSSTGDKVLVVLEPELKKEDYSMFFESLETRGYKLTFRAPTDAQPAIFVYDVPQFSHVIMFAPTTKSFAGDLSPQSLVHLLKEEPTTNLLVALSPTITPLSHLAAEFSLGLPLANMPLVSHFPARTLPHTVIFLNPPPPTPGSDFYPLLNLNITPLFFEGQAHLVGDNPQAFSILHAPAVSFSTDTTEDRSSDVLVEAADKGGEGLWAGGKMSVVSGFQATTGARAVFAGGIKLFSDEFAKMEMIVGLASGNAQLGEDLTSWAFRENMVLRVESTEHYLTSDPTHTQKEFYTTNSNLTFNLHLTQYEPTTGSYLPKSDIEDMQLEFTMLDPHIRTALKPVSGHPGTYSLTFRAPDRHGVYKFVVNYKRKGWTSVQVAMPVAIVPPRHDGYPRFLSAAWPYYAGAISTSVGFILFCFVYLGGEMEEQRKRKAKGKGKVE